MGKPRQYVVHLERGLANQSDRYNHVDADTRQNIAWVDDAKAIDMFGDTKYWFINLAGMMGLVMDIKSTRRCFCYEQCLVSTRCSDGILDVSKNHFELLETELNVEKGSIKSDSSSRNR